MTKLTLTEFLLARIAEDEAEDARRSHFGDGSVRMRSECAAKRRIMAIYRYVQMSEPDDGFPSVPLGGDGPETYYETLQHLAAVHADHPDYDEEWRP